jgi:hypothetical protein
MNELTPQEITAGISTRLTSIPTGWDVAIVQIPINALSPPWTTHAPSPIPIAASYGNLNEFELLLTRVAPLPPIDMVKPITCSLNRMMSFPAEALMAIVYQPFHQKSRSGMFMHNRSERLDTIGAFMVYGDIIYVYLTSSIVDISSVTPKKLFACHTRAFTPRPSFKFQYPQSQVWTVYTAYKDTIVPQIERGWIPFTPPKTVPSNTLSVHLQDFDTK